MVYSRIFQNNYKKTNPTSIKTLAEQLVAFFKAKNISGVSLIIAGYEQNEIGKAYLVNLGQEVDERLSRTTNAGGFLRIGQDDVVTRIINGRSQELFELDFVKKAQDEGVDIVAELNKAHYIVNWGTITLQDAVDFCVLMTKITESVQRFSDGTFLHPGSVPGVGGSIDVAIITADNGFEWTQKKELKVPEK